MGHYDSFYEYDREQSQKVRNTAMKNLRTILDEFTLKTKQTSGEVPERFLDTFEDYRNWLTAQIKESK